MTIEINYVAVLLAAVSSMAVGALWYARSVFGTTWMKLVKLDPKKAQEGAFTALALTFVVSLVTAYILAHVIYLAHHFFGNPYLQDALSTGFWLWLGLVAARFITHDLFEQRPGQLTMLNIAHELVTIMMMSVIIGLFG